MFKTLTPALSIILAIIIFVFFTKPQYAEVQRMSAEVNEYEQTIEDYDALKSLLDSLVSEKNSVPIADRERLDRMIPTEVATTQTLVDLESLAREAGLLFGNVVTSERTNKPADIARAGEASGMPRTYQMLTDDVSFELIGTYDQLKAFLVAVESNLAFMDVTELSLVASTQNFQQYAVTVRTYAISKSL